MVRNIKVIQDKPVEVFSSGFYLDSSGDFCYVFSCLDFYNVFIS